MKRYRKRFGEQRGEGKGIGNGAQQDGGADVCICPSCGHEEPHERGVPCTNQTCPKCDTKMIGQ